MWILVERHCRVACRCIVSWGIAKICKDMQRYVGSWNFSFGIWNTHLMHALHGKFHSTELHNRGCWPCEHLGIVIFFKHWKARGRGQACSEPGQESPRLVIWWDTEIQSEYSMYIQFMLETTCIHWCWNWCVFGHDKEVDEVVWSLPHKTPENKVGWANDSYSSCKKRGRDRALRTLQILQCKVESFCTASTCGFPPSGMLMILINLFSAFLGNTSLIPYRVLHLSSDAVISDFCTCVSDSKISSTRDFQVFWCRKFWIVGFAANVVHHRKQHLCSTCRWMLKQAVN